MIKLFHDKLSALRRELYQQLRGTDERRILKGTRWLLLKNPENLDSERNEHERLAEALRLNAPLATAYYLKEDLRQLWQQANKRQARRVLRDWVARARIRLEPLRWQACDGVVVVEQTAQWQQPDGPLTETQHVASVFRVRDGKLSSVLRYDDLASALRAAGLDASSSA